MFYVYMIRNSLNRLYIGVTQNPEQRLSSHNSRRGALFTKYVKDFKIVFLEPYPTFLFARQREIQIKKWRRKKKDTLINRYKMGLSTKNASKLLNHNGYLTFNERCINMYSK